MSDDPKGAESAPRSRMSVATATANAPAIVIIEYEVGDASNIGIYGPFASHDEAGDQADEWRAKDGDSWGYRVRRLLPPDEWEAM